MIFRQLISEIPCMVHPAGSTTGGRVSFCEHITVSQLLLSCIHMRTIITPWPTCLCNWMEDITTLVWISSLPRTYLSPCCVWQHWLMHKWNGLG